MVEFLRLIVRGLFLFVFKAAATAVVAWFVGAFIFGETMSAQAFIVVWVVLGLLIFAFPEIWARLFKTS